MFVIVNTRNVRFCIKSIEFIRSSASKRGIETSEQLPSQNKCYCVFSTFLNGLKTLIADNREIIEQLMIWKCKRNLS